MSPLFRIQMSPVPPFRHPARQDRIILPVIIKLSISVRNMISRLHRINKVLRILEHSLKSLRPLSRSFVSNCPSFSNNISCSTATPRSDMVYITQGFCSMIFFRLGDFYIPHCRFPSQLFIPDKNGLYVVLYMRLVSGNCIISIVRVMLSIVRQYSNHKFPTSNFVQGKLCQI